MWPQTHGQLSLVARCVHGRTNLTTKINFRGTCKNVPRCVLLTAVSMLESPRGHHRKSGIMLSLVKLIALLLVVCCSSLGKLTVGSLLTLTSTMHRSLREGLPMECNKVHLGLSMDLYKISCWTLYNMFFPSLSLPSPFEYSLSYSPSSNWHHSWPSH